MGIYWHNLLLIWHFVQSSVALPVNPLHLFYMLLSSRPRTPQSYVRSASAVLNCPIVPTTPPAILKTSGGADFTPEAWVQTATRQLSLLFETDSLSILAFGLKGFLSSRPVLFCQYDFNYEPNQDPTCSYSPEIEAIYNNTLPAIGIPGLFQGCPDFTPTLEVHCGLLLVSGIKVIPLVLKTHIAGDLAGDIEWMLHEDNGDRLPFSAFPKLGRSLASYFHVGTEATFRSCDSEALTTLIASRSGVTMPQNPILRAIYQQTVTAWFKWAGRDFQVWKH